MTKLSKKAKNQIAALRHHYIQTLSESVEMIHQGWKTIGRSRDSKDELTTLQRLVHTLRGSSGTFGLVKIADLAELIEERISVAVESGEEEDCRSVDLALLDLAELADRRILESKSSENDDTCLVEFPPKPQVVDPDETTFDEEASGNATVDLGFTREISDNAYTVLGSVAIVEDDESMSKVLQTFLTDAGYSCRVIREATGAAEQIFDFAPDVVLLDVILPDGSGFEVCRKIRERNEFKQTPVIFLTAIKREAAMLRAFELGGDDYLIKPYNPGILLAKIRRCLERRKGLDGKIFKKGAVIGDYRILEPIGRGGMAEVFRVEDQRDGSIWALKLLSLKAGDVDKGKLRFKREIEALQLLKHSNILKLRDHGEIEGHLYYIMEYLPGGSLSDKIIEKRLDPIHALDVTAEIAAALHYVHSRGMLHRDLKPDNILFDADGRPVLADFGIFLNMWNESPRLTTVGIVVGSPCYMSPEQIERPDEIDGRSDVYSLGIVLAEMLTGRVPFDDLDAFAALRRKTEADAPPPSSLGPVPWVIDRLVAKATRRHPASRYEDAAAFGKACQVATLELEAAQDPEGEESET